MLTRGTAISLLMGLMLLALAFSLEDQAWIEIPQKPLGPIEHPIHMAIGGAGLFLLLLSAWWLRQHKQDEDGDNQDQ